MNPFPLSHSGALIYEQIESQFSELDLVRRNITPSNLTPEIQSMPADKLLGGAIKNKPMAEAVKAGLCVALDAWEEAHSIAQDLDTAEGSYWHGIIHRREPDGGNAKYWYRRVGEHPVLFQLGSDETRKTLSSTTAFDQITELGSWDPFIFIDLCMASENGQQPELKTELLALQTKEIQLLIGHCIKGVMAK